MTTIFERLGARPIINASGIYTDLGGSRPSPAVWAAMTEINGSFVSMVELLERAGNTIAGRLGAEAGTITPGAAASIALMVSAAVTGTDGAAGERLPDTAGLRDQIVLQRGHRYKYDRQVALTGAKLALAGDERGTSTDQLRQAIGPRTAALLFPGHLDGAPGTVRLPEAVEVAHQAGIPVLVDAAYQCWPLETFGSHLRAGADLLCASAKYFGGPNAGGFVVGTRALIEAVRSNDFTRYESGSYRTFGRTLKMDRQTVAGVVTAFEEWWAMDHQERLARSAALVRRIGVSLAGLRGLVARPMAFTMDERLVPEPVNALVLDLPGGRAARVADLLEQGAPRILAVREPDRLIFCVDVMDEAEAAVVGERLRIAIAADG